MKNLRFEVVSETSATVSWETDKERCHVWYYPKGDGLQKEFHVNAPQRADGTFPGRGDPDYFPHRTRNLSAPSNVAIWRRVKALIGRTDVPAAFAEYAAAEKARQEENARKRRIEALRAAFKLIGEANLDDLSEAISADWREAERASAAIHEYVR